MTNSHMQQYLTPRPRTGLQARECRTSHVDSASDILSTPIEVHNLNGEQQKLINPHDEIIESLFTL